MGSFQSFGVNSKSNTTPPPTILPPGGIAVHFRPKTDWDGSQYGFDWLRIGDSGLPADKEKLWDHYVYLLGKYYENGTNAKGDDANSWKTMEPKLTNPALPHDKATNPHLAAKPISFKNDLVLFAKYKTAYFDETLLAPWKLNEPAVPLAIVPLKKSDLFVNLTSTPIYDPSQSLINMEIPVYEKIKACRDTYYIPTMTLRFGRTANLNLIVEIEDGKTPPDELIFKCEKNSEGKDYFSFSHTNPLPTPLTKGTYECSIECKSVLNQDTTIEVFAVFKSPKGKKTENLCGKLKVKKNNTIRKVKVLFANVVFEYTKPSAPVSTTKTGTLIAGEADAIKNILNQAYIELDSNVDSVIKLPLIEAIRSRFEKSMIYTINPSLGSYDDTRLGVMLGGLDYCLKEYLKNNVATNAKYQQYIDEYDECIKVYNLDISCYKDNTPGLSKNGSTNVEAKSIIHFSSKGKDTCVHEILHAMNLEHSFSSAKQDYTYLAQRTDNIMDYSHWGQRPVTRISTWQWQWQILHQYVDRINITISHKRMIKVAEEKMKKLKEDAMKSLKKSAAGIIKNSK